MVWTLESTMQDLQNDSNLREQHDSATNHIQHDTDSIGYYKNMWNDFELLHKELSATIEDTLNSSSIFNLATFISLFRMQTLKYK